MKRQIETHLMKLEEDINEKSKERGEYHSKEIENSLLKEAKHRLDILKKADLDIQMYEKKLKELNIRLDDLGNDLV